MQLSRIAFGLMVGFISAPLFAQTNTFPSTGNVGVGTTSPSNPLEVRGIVRVSNGTDYGWIFAGSSGGLDAFHVGSFTNVPLAFFTNASAPKMTIDVSGNVGIGTTSPIQKLEVNGGYARIAYANGPFLDFYHAAAGPDLKTTRIGSVNGALLFESVNDLYTIPIERMRIAPDGSVGIGTNAPAAALHVRRAGQSELRLQSNGRQWALLTNEGWGNNGFSVYDISADVSRLQIDTAGNLGIGTTSPVRALTIGGSSSTEMVFQTASRPVDQRNYRLYSAAGGLFFGTLNDAGTSGVNHFAINQTNGNVGIGTDAPTHKLAVNGTIRAKEVIVDTGWADHVFAADYRLAPLSEVEQHIQQRGHLPDVPSAADVAERGVSVGEMQKILLQKIEELTLHVISQEKRIQSLEAENARLRADN